MSIPHSKRVCQIIKLRPEAVEEYKTLHAAAWPAILATLKRSHVADYSINYYAPMGILIATMKYTGPPEDFEKDMAAIGEDEETRRWWKVTDPLQESLVEGATGSADGKWWDDLEEVFRLE